MSAIPLGIVGLFTLSLLAGPAGGQEGDTVPPTSRPPDTGGWGAVSVAPRPGSTVVSAAVALPVGSERDGDQPGRAWLLAHTIQEATLASLEPGVRAATEVAVEVGRGRTVFRLLTLPRYWSAAWNSLERRLFDTPPDAIAMERKRDEVAEVMTFESDAPVREFQLEFYRTLGGLESAWSRPPRADLPALSALSVASITRFRDEEYRRGDATVAVVGAVSAGEAAATVTGDRRPASPEGGTVVDDGFRPLTPDDEAWQSGDRLVLTREVTSSWIGVAYPVDEETPRTVLEFLAHKLEASFRSSPPDPGVFHTEVRLERLGRRPFLVLEAAVLPEATLEWERRLLQAVETLAAEPLRPGFFRRDRRRFRSELLLAEAAPEVESLRRALDLLREGRVRNLEERIWRLTPEALHEAASDLGPPRVTIFGPDLSTDALPEQDRPQDGQP